MLLMMMLTGADSADYHVADDDGGDDTGDYACDGGDGGYGIVVRPGTNNTMYAMVDRSSCLRIRLMQRW